MTLLEFEQIIINSENPVILLEGKRAIPRDDYLLASRVGEMLAARFPNARFRSGNAEGADQAFSEGVARVDPSRLQIIAPYARHRMKARIKYATYDYPDSLSAVAEESIIYQTIQATPEYRKLFEARNDRRSLEAKSRYLIRDTMKVIGSSGDFPPPAAALFYADLSDPGSGGTGHTIRVCRLQKIPVVLQDSWATWV